MDSKQQINKLTIVGGGTAGWLTATLFAKVMGKQLTITLVESKDIASIGVGEATIPAIVAFNRALGIDEAQFIRETHATIKLGIQFDGWSKTRKSYMHAFGQIGKDFPFCDFYQHWLKARKEGSQYDYWDFSLNYQAAKLGRFEPLHNITGTHLSGLAYAYHFDAFAYAKFLRQYAQELGVKRVEGTVESVSLHPETGEVRHVILTDSQQISGDLFIDCTGTKGLLIDKAVNSGFEDWSHWLPCDRAMAVQTLHPDEDEIPLMTRSSVHEAGWIWRIPLQHRFGNGIVYSSRHMCDAKAESTLLSSLSSPPINDVNIIRFRTGRRLRPWCKNVVAIGLSAGFLEPLESTSIHLIQTAATRLLKLFPHKNNPQANRDAFNRETQLEYEQVRDFIILHYKLNNRADSDFWRWCYAMDIPTSLQRKIALYKACGVSSRVGDELFTPIAWQQVMLGQGVIPDQLHPLVDSLTCQQRQDLLADLSTLIEASVSTLPSHRIFLARKQMN